ncbi:putative ammonia monooxygenase [Proteus hauseri ATCC 700826]|uniref:Ammonia monooxygenase n=1 Tax=Proteus hauseri ATCC 700826 TaxID=1354271 RepID=A0AAJ3HU91_PROHU|nr:AbrB family transcriptional regulator [Proteus hauseri]OAT48624.1 putative ammonia monooxygenase [Proteus hauseri ATCC 700826]
MSFLKTIPGILFCSLIGAGLTFLGLPMALMFGPIIVVIIAFRFGIELSVPKHTLTFIQLTLGTSVGLMFNQVHLGSADNLIILLLTLVICLAIQFFVSYFWFYRHIGWTKEEAMLGAVPGAMAAILALTDHTKTPPQKIVISHTIRLMVLIIMAGIIVGGDKANMPEFALPQMTMLSFTWLLLIVAVGLFSGLLLQKIRFPAPFMLTSLGSAVLIQSFVSEPIAFPMLLNELSMVLIGMNIGAHFVVFPLSSLIKNAFSSVQVVIINVILTVIVAFSAAYLTGVPWETLVLAWAPGSMEAMTFAAITMNVDAAFVMSNHIFRMLIIQSIPSVALFWNERKQKKSNINKE